MRDLSAHSQGAGGRGAKDILWGPGSMKKRQVLWCDECEINTTEDATVEQRPHFDLALCGACYIEALREELHDTGYYPEYGGEG